MELPQVPMFARQTLHFRMQRDASLKACDSLSHLGNTSTLARQRKGSTSIKDHNVALVNHP